MITSENERSFQIKLIGWLNEILITAKHVVNEAGGEKGVKVGEKKTNFPDVILWLNKAQETAVATIELKDTNTSVDDTKLISNGVPKAKALKAKYFLTWNVRDTILWDISGSKPEPLHRYPPLLTVRTIEDINVPQTQEQIRERAREILADLDDYVQTGRLHPHPFDSLAFANSLHYSVDTLTPSIKDSLRKKYSKDKAFQKGFALWTREQGIEHYDTEAYFTTAARQVIYKTLGRILFYFALRRCKPDLPQLCLDDTNLDRAQEILQGAFEEVRAIDYQAVFEPDITDAIPWSTDSARILQSLLTNLAYYNFDKIPLDVIGAVFENLIPPNERHSLGQFYTREDLVDFIDGFVVRSKDDTLFDPTCGTGTFLMRAYNRLYWLYDNKQHQKLLTQLWGNDIAQFPAELATINLYVRRLEEANNYPRILNRDFFDLKPSEQVEFPHPSKGLDPQYKIHVPLPRFDGMMGNFPYIRQELIEKVKKGHKQTLEKLLAFEWLAEYPELFEKLPKHSQLVLEHWLENGAKPDAAAAGKLFEEAKIKLSGQADIYAYMFFHAARLLKSGGRMAFLTSNSWLDVAYGYELQKFFTSKFNIIAVIESRCEPWFPDAAVNTIITVLERSDNPKPDHPVRFVKIKKPLAELLKSDPSLEFHNRHLRVNELVARIEEEGDKGKEIAKGIYSYEDDNFRIRTLNQEELRRQLETEGKAVKWGKFLRAPDVYFELMEKLGDKLVPLSTVADVRFGIKTGINEFFYLTEEKARQYGIEEEYLKPVVKSPKEIEGLVVDPARLRQRLFLCNKSKEELRKLGHKGALKYIQDVGEKGATKKGVKWPEVPSVQGRKHWYGIQDREPAQVLGQMITGDRYFAALNPSKAYIDHNLFEFFPFEVSHEQLWSSLSFVASFLYREINGRSNLGDGALKFEGIDWEACMIPDPKLLPKLKIPSRPTPSIFDELKRKDRQAFDSAILEALGLDPREWLPRIYAGLTELVKERLDLPRMRKKQREVRKARSTEQVINDLVKDNETGIRTFPQDFLPSKVKTHKVSLPAPKFERLVDMGMFPYLVAEGKQYDFKSVHEAKFAFYAQKSSIYVIEVPTDPVILAKVIKEYELWANTLHEKIHEAAMGRVNEYAQAVRITEQVLERLGVRVLP
ncbi:SAM-dependent DNA methyltransferase [candidate division WOR-3 bacterium]|nr:SAM-dependent DNA methyltransferase [candidate division WOR-3 bacterium]